MEFITEAGCLKCPKCGSMNFTVVVQKDRLLIECTCPAKTKLVVKRVEHKKPDNAGNL